MPTLCECNVDLSIIIPVYNLEKFIEPMLKSLNEQDHGDYNIETIFVLNNCTDNSEGVIRNSGLDCTIIECTTQGCGPARNAGIELAHGKYIWFMDGDDWLLCDTAVREALDKAEERGTDILRLAFKSNYFRYGYFSMVWQYLFRHEFIQEFHFPEKQPGEDDEYTQQVLAKAGYTVSQYTELPFFGKPLYYYNYLREGSNMYRCSMLGEKI